jgi:alkylhydroperoxidase/carboxymuconolactone decarboxylase family protein YurZ
MRVAVLRRPRSPEALSTAWTTKTLRRSDMGGTGSQEFGHFEYVETLDPKTRELAALAAAAAGGCSH